MQLFNFNLRTWSAPHWVTVLASTAGGALIGYLWPLLQTGTLPESKEAWIAIGRGALIAVLAAVVSVAKTLLPAPEQAAHNKGTQVKISGAGAVES
jgi:uncharacterized integral membrane protein